MNHQTPELLIVSRQDNFKDRLVTCWGLVRMQWRILRRGVTSFHPIIKQRLYIDPRELIKDAVLEEMLKQQISTSETSADDHESRKPTIH